MDRIVLSLARYNIVIIDAAKPKMGFDFRFLDIGMKNCLCFAVFLFIGFNI